MAALPVLAAVAHHYCRLSFEGGIANTPLYADPYNPVYTRSWFWGALGEKLSAHWWLEVLRLVGWMVVTPGGVLIAVAGLVGWRRIIRQAGIWILVVWCAGLAVYVFVFLRIVATHDYWRLPFMAPMAVVLGVGANEILERTRTRGSAVSIVTLIVLLALYGASIRPAFRRGPYFQIDWQRIRAGEAIARTTAPGDLVLSSCIGRGTGPTDPRILNFADRRGWANRIEDLTADMLRVYRSAGARVAAVLVTPEHLPLSDAPEWMLVCPRTEAALEPPASGAVLFYKLDECEP